MIFCRTMFLWTIMGVLYLTKAAAVSDRPLLLLITFDGWRYDLLDEKITPTLWHFAKAGVHFTKGVQSQYLTVTGPNHMSIATGLLQESHGIVGNEFYDPVFDAHYDVFNMSGDSAVARDSLNERWYKGEPIWLTNERAGNGRTSGSMHWPAADANFPGNPSQPKLYKPYATIGDAAYWHHDVDAIMEWLTRDGGDPANFVAWYVADPDHELHEHGFNSTEFNANLKALDELFAYLLERVNQLGLKDRLNIIFTADHGHVQIAKYEQLICISEYVNVTLDGIETGDHMLYIKNESLAEHYYTQLTAAISKHSLGMKVYRKKDFPEKYGYKNTRRVGNIILLPDEGWSLSFNCTNASMDTQYKQNPSSWSHSTHGQDPFDWQMRAVLVLNGPAFESGLDIDAIPSNIDLYPLMCRVLAVHCAPHNGSLSVIGRALRGHADKSSVRSRLEYFLDEHGSLWNVRFLVVVCSVVAPVLLFILYVCLSLRASSERPSISTQGYSRLKNGSLGGSATLTSLPAATNSLIGDADSMSEDDL